MKELLALLFLCQSLCTAAKENLDAKAHAIFAEGKRLYTSEMASWYGTDLFAELYRDKEKVGGYFSYAENDKARCVFYSKGESPKVIWTITFDSTFNVKTANIDNRERELDNMEREFYTIREAAKAIIKSDTFFKVYKDTNLNLIPDLYDGARKVYILTSPEKNGVILLGNDYLLTFHKTGSLKSKKQLHRNLIPIAYSNDTLEKQTMHTHLPETGDFITPTDVCTLMLYGRFTHWKQHYVTSSKYISFWLFRNNNLIILPKSVIRKINEHQEKTEPEK